MSHQSEIDHIDKEGLGENLPTSVWEFEIDLGNNSDQVWTRIVGVVRRIATYGYDDWPEDEYWKNTLPEWLTTSMMTLEECKDAMVRTPRERWDQLPWEIGSWLEAMREREWKWWGYKRSGNHVRLVLEVTNIPPRVDAFQQILLASGAQIISGGF